MAKQQWEVEAKDRFLAFLQESRGEEWKVLAQDFVVAPHSGRNFDYQLGSDGKRIALEIFRLVEDEKDLARQKVWGEVVQLLKQELTSRDVKDYLIRTPSFRVAKVQREQLARDLADQLEQAIKANSGAEEFKVDDFVLAKIEGLGTVTFSTFGKAGAVNPPGIALAALEEKLPDKNEQLSIAGHERVILIINWAFIIGADEVTEACSQIDFSHFGNIDKVYFESRAGTIHLVFDRELFKAFDGFSAAPSAALEPLYLRWLEYRLTRKESKVFELVKKLADERGNLLWLPAYTRREVVLYGEAFIKAKNWDNVMWIVRHFRDDPDPGIANESDDPEGQFNYHLRIQKNEEIRIITTVRGHLCWLLQKVVCESRTDLYREIVDIVEEYATGQNLYIRQQAAVPLIELARRRRARKPNDEPFMTPDLAQRVRDLAFRMLRENSELPAVLERVGHIFVYMRDLNETEAREVLHTLLASPTDESSGVVALLMIHFALFRKGHFLELGPFNNQELSDLLRHQVIGGRPRVRAHTMWHLWKLLDEEKAAHFEDIAPYVVVLPEGLYEASAFHHFYRITAVHVHEHADLLGPALRKAFEREKEFLQANPHETMWHFEDTWNSLTGLFEVRRIGCFLDCVEELLQYRHRIAMFPSGLIEELLCKVEADGHKARAIQLLEKLKEKS